MAVNVGPLTTIFTPPASCTSVVTLGFSPEYGDEVSLFIGHWASYTPASAACYPQSATPFDFWTQEYYWSPGICPEGFTTACNYGVVTHGPDTSASLCCPSLVLSLNDMYLAD